MRLTSSQLDLLRTLAGGPPLRPREVDGRSLRGLLARRLVRIEQDRVSATPAGVRLASGGAAPGPRAPALSEAQVEVLRSLLRQSGPVPAAHLDGRILRALAERGAVTIAGQWVSPSAHAGALLTAQDQRARRRRLRRAAGSPEAARAEVLLRAVEQLERAIPLDAVIMVGDGPAYADDLLAGLRRHARDLERNS